MATKSDDKTLSTEDGLDPRHYERRRAAEYLDLWERHVTFSAIHGNPAGLPPSKLVR